MASTGHGDGDDMHVKLLVKAPDQQIDDQTVECTLDWTVNRLKDHLANVYPGKPKHEEQKIIFLGQLLNDSMILRDVLQQYYTKDNSLFIVHLVCGGQSKWSSTGKTGASGVAVNANTPPVVSATSLPVQPNSVQQYYSQLNSQQMAWMQQAYAHYLIRYMQIMAAQEIQIESNPLYNQPLRVNTNGTEVANNNNGTTINNNNNSSDNNAGESETAENEAARDTGLAEDAPADQQQVPGDANIANNNQNAPVDEAAGGAAPNHDWLDIFDMLSRGVVFSSIVYFYSSPSRCLIVTFLGFAIYLIQGGFFRAHPAFLADNNNARVADNNNQELQNAAVVPGGHTPAPAQQPPRIPTGSPVEQHVAATRTNLNEDNERPGAWAFTWTFFSSFFASLIPDQPNVI